MLDTIKRAGRAVANYAAHREPVVVINALAGSATAAVADWQGDLHGTAAWVAVAWAALALLQRHLVSPTPAARP